MWETNYEEARNKGAFSEPLDIYLSSFGGIAAAYDGINELFY